MKHVATFRIRGAEVPCIYRAILPEIGEMGRSRVDIACDGEDALVLRVAASDIPALRAAINSWLRLVNVAYEMQELVRHE
ncbi:MAG: hypothetical protein GKC04_00110 [Methanomicrobiales archaeon]|nr:hypothetical protein [Methanomicrobiales archaeon]